MSSRFRLRYQAIDFNLGVDEFVVGRTTECDLVLDDGLVSRRHASFRVQGENVQLKDLGSRNGVSVNSAPVNGGALLQPGDRVRIGSHELLLVEVSRTQVASGTAELIRCKVCDSFQELGKSCANCNAVASKAAATASADSVTREAPAMQLAATLGGTMLADKAISLGRFDEAERLLSPRLSSLLGQAPHAAAIERDVLSVASGYALRLAEGLHKPSWLDYPFELYLGARALMPADVIEDLFRAAGKVRYANPLAVRRYLSGLRSRSDTFGANERFLLQRIEGLERRIANG
jgi:predicted component of type VI protein secretion system